jgi:hypothetical protein
VEARGESILPCPHVSPAKQPDFSDYDLAHLPMFLPGSKDVLAEIIYIGKAVLKEAFLKGR